MAKGVGDLCCTLGLPIPSKAWLPFSSILASWMGGLETWWELWPIEVPTAVEAS